MGWTFVRLTRDQLIRELTATEETERSRSEVIDHTLVGNVLWTVASARALLVLPVPQEQNPGFCRGFLLLAACRC